MTRKKHTAEQIVKKLRITDQLRAEGKTTAQVARQMEISAQTFHCWKNQYGDMQGDQVKRLKELEHENSRLKKADRLRQLVKGPARSGVDESQLASVASSHLCNRFPCRTALAGRPSSELGGKLRARTGGRAAPAA